MKTHKIAVRNRRLFGVPFTVVQGCSYADQIELDLDEEFDVRDGITVTIYSPDYSPEEDGMPPQEVGYVGEPLILPDDASRRAGWLGLMVKANDCQTHENIVTALCDHAIRVAPSYYYNSVPK